MSYLFLIKAFHIIFETVKYLNSQIFDTPSMLAIRTKAITSNIVTYEAVHTATILAMPCSCCSQPRSCCKECSNFARSQCSSHGHTLTAVGTVPTVGDINDDHNLVLKIYLRVLVNTNFSVLFIIMNYPSSYKNYQIKFIYFYY